MAIWRRFARALIPGAALAAGGAVTWVSIGRVPRGLGWLGLFSTAFQLCFAAGTVAALAALCVWQAGRRGVPGLGLSQSVQRAAICALWLPPLLILARRESPWALLPACLLAFTAGRLFARPRLEPQQGGSWMAHSLLLAALLQATVVTVAAGHMAAACAAAGLWVVLLANRVARPVRKPVEARQSLTPSRRVLGMVAAAAMLTVTGLVHYLRPGFGFGEGSLMASLFGGGAPRNSQGPARPGREPRRFTSDDLSASHRAVILLPEQKEGVIGLIPPLPALAPSLSRGTRTEDLAIPFYGVYWLLRPPDVVPPPDAITMRGDPAFRGFRSNDSAPLVMEARQNLGMLVSLACCSAIELEILNADTYARTISLELLLVNTTRPGKPRVSLGALPVRSEVRFSLRGPGARAPGIVAEETLSFPLREGLAITEFDEFRVRFETARLRANRSPRVSIGRFRLVRGRI